MVFVPYWLGTEAIAMFIVVAVLARLHKTWSVVDYVLLKIERYVSHHAPTPPCCAPGRFSEAACDRRSR